jgi:ubiquinone/menaquinone biosynthesis C-methylase UbiE
MFHAHGYRTAGLELHPTFLKEAEDYCKDADVELGIQRGDMRSIPFADGSFSFAYSYNAVFFMTKEDIRRSISEMCRVLRPSGLCYVNLMSVDDPDDGDFGESSYLRKALGSPRFAKHEDTEGDSYFVGCEVIWKEKRTNWVPHDGGTLTRAYIDYVVRKHSGLPDLRFERQGNEAAKPRR